MYSYSSQILSKTEFSRHIFEKYSDFRFNPLNAELNPICHLLALFGAHHIFHVSGLRIKDNPISGSRVIPCGWTERHDDADSHFSKIYERA